MPLLKSKVPTLYVGIDPGVNGGIAYLGNHSPLIGCAMPATERDLWKIFKVLGEPLEYRGLGTSPSCLVVAVVEWIHPAIQGIGKADMSKLYGNYMQCRLSLTAAQIPFETVMPKDWQRALGISPRKKGETVTKWKDRLRGRAQQLFPRLSCWDLSVTEQRKLSDAILIAEFCRRKHEGLLV